MNILKEIIEFKHSEIKERARITPLERIQDSQRLYSIRDFYGALANEGIQIIAEIKRRSPSFGQYRALYHGSAPGLETGRSRGDDAVFPPLGHLLAEHNAAGDLHR